MANTIPENVDFNSFGDNIISVAKDIKAFTAHMEGVDVSDAVSQVKKIVELAKSLKGVAGNFDAFEKSLKNLGSKSVSHFIQAFSGSHDKIKSATTKFVDAGKKAVRNKYKDFKEAGKYLVEGFAKGISENTFKAEAKAKAMAKAAEDAAKAELQEHSPSRVFYGIGDFAGIAFVNALGDYVSKAYDAGSGLASSATSGLNFAMAKMQSVIDGGMDVQPTITPVLDLSNVSDGVGRIGSMFRLQPSIGLLSNVGTISAAMNSRNQNGTDDVVSAINRLGRALGNMPSGDTSNVGDVSYDDGSEIADAVKTLVRAARVERRT